MKITSSDFNQLTLNSAKWAEEHIHWQSQEGRFEDIDYREDKKDIDYTFLNVYWVQNYASVLFIKAFLAGLGYDFAVYFDTFDDLYIVATNYKETK